MDRKGWTSGWTARRKHDATSAGSPKGVGGRTRIRAEERSNSMARMINRLTAVTVTKLNTPGLYFDGDGLLLKVVQGRDAPTKSWVFRYRVNGKRRDMGLGPLRTFSLIEARERARQLRKK